MRLFKPVANNQPSGSSDSVIFDGLGDNREALRHYLPRSNKRKCRSC